MSINRTDRLQLDAARPGSQERCTQL